jgi:hypothetical protein
VNVSVQSVVSTTFFQQGATTARATQAVSGLGEAAYVTPIGAQVGSILVMKGHNELRMDVYVPITATTQAALQQLARTAIGRVG